MSTELISTVCIATCDRPEQLTIALKGLIANLNIYGHKPRILIVDDSDNPDSSIQSREIIKKFENEYNGKFEFIDRNDRRILAEDIAREKGLDGDMVKFCLLGDKSSYTTLGSSQNTALLRTRGEKMMFIDDDVVYNFFKPQKLETPIFSMQNEIQYDFLNADSPLPDSYTHTNIDILKLHSECIGNRSNTILTDESFQYIPEYKILDSYMGSYGDSPMESHIPLFILPQVYEKLGSVSKDQYESMKNTRRIAQSVPSTTIYQGQMCISMVMAIDNREMVPVFIPNGRGQDLVFGSIRNKAFPLHVSAHLPVLIGHERPTKETRNMEFNVVYEMTKMNRFLSNLILNFNNIEMDPAINLEKIGIYLVDIARMDTEKFAQFVQDYCKQITRSIAFNFNSIIENNKGAPDFWIQDMQSMITALVSPDTQLFLADITKTDNSILTFKKWLHLYSEVLKNWPIIYRV